VVAIRGPVRSAPESFRSCDRTAKRDILASMSNAVERCLFRIAHALEAQTDILKHPTPGLDSLSESLLATRTDLKRLHTAAQDLLNDPSTKLGNVFLADTLQELLNEINNNH